MEGKGNPNAVLGLVLLRRLLSLLQECASRVAPITALSALGLRRSHGTLDDAFISAHADIVFEILDEAIDGGVPQTSDFKVLLLFAEANAGLKGSGGGGQADTSEGGIKLAAQATGVAPWRRPGIRYRKNEIYIDVVERVHALVAQNGTILRQEVEGKVVVRCLLSGMPECKLATNEIAAHFDRPMLDGTRIQAITNAPLRKIVPDPSKHPTGGPLPAGGEGGPPVVTQRIGQDLRGNPGPSWAKSSVRLTACRYHQCVRLAKHSTDKVLVFMPPDGNCEVMTYRWTYTSIYTNI
ncbi:hypothetical protein Emed_002548 [Eimeria media]